MRTIILNIAIIIHVTSSDWNQPNDEEWVDPRSMFDDTNIKKSSSESNLHDKSMSLENEAKTCQNAEFTFFKRFISSIERQFINLKSEKNGKYVCDISLSQTSFKYLTEFSDKSSSMEKMTILENMFSNIKWVDFNEQITESYLSSINYEYVYIFLLIIISTLFIIKVAQTFYIMNLSMFQIFVAILFLLFIISVPWTWFHLYQKAKSKKMAEIYKGLPAACNSENYGIWQNLMAMLTFSSSDQCAKYFENTEVHPFLEVTPTMALSVTMTRFILEPAEYIGEAFRRFLTATFEGLPLYLYIPVIIFFIIIFTTSVLTMFRYRLRTILFSIEPVGGSVDNSKDIQQLQLQNQQLQNRLLELESKKTLSVETGAGDAPQISMIDFSQDFNHIKKIKVEDTNIAKENI